MSRPAVAAALVLAVASTVAPLRAQRAVAPAASVASLTTRPERSDYRETSSYADVMAFVGQVARASPRLHLSTFGYTTLGRALPLVVVRGAGAPDAAAVRASGKVRVYLQGNIHAGEVEGKEALQLLLRALARGEHAHWLDSLILLVAPIYNADGNEEVRLTSRGRQNGPLGGTGQRPNAQNLDLNRDHTKLESPEARSFVGLLRDYDPEVTIDLHTTNGTRHAYHLTYAPPLHPNTDAGILERLRGDWLPAVTRAVKTKRGWDMYYYGNVPGDEGPGRAERGWYTFDHRPRFNNNYVGLRNRFGILSEAYSYASFEDRIRATLWFVEELLDHAYRHASAIRAAVAAADRAGVVGRDLAVRAVLARSDTVTILMGDVAVERHPLTGSPVWRRLDVARPERMPDYGTFVAAETARAPAVYYVPAELTTVLNLLDAHGVRRSSLAQPVTRTVERFAIDSTTQEPREFQGHRERSLFGRYEAAELTLPAGTAAVPVDQPLGRLVFTLLEPRSDDGVVTWNVLDAALAGARYYPITRAPGP